MKVTWFKLSSAYPPLYSTATAGVASAPYFGPLGSVLSLGNSVGVATSAYMNLLTNNMRRGRSYCRRGECRSRSGQCCVFRRINNRRNVCPRQCWSCFSFELKNKSLFDIILRVFCRIKLINVVGCRIYFSLDSECSKLIRGIYLLYTLTTHNTIKIASLWSEKKILSEVGLNMKYCGIKYSLGKSAL